MYVSRELHIRGERVEFVKDKEVYEALLNRRGLIDKRYEEVEFLLFSLSGFSKWVKENAEPGRIRLVTLEELYG